MDRLRLVGKGPSSLRLRAVFLTLLDEETSNLEADGQQPQP